MRSLFILVAVAACDPVWRVSNVATPTATTHANESCIHDALTATTFRVRPMGVNAPAHGWYVASPGHEMRVTWDPRQPQKLTLEMLNVGEHAPPNTLEAYRFMRDSILSKLSASCGTFDPGPETCARMTCGS